MHYVSLPVLCSGLYLQVPLFLYMFLFLMCYIISDFGYPMRWASPFSHPGAVSSLIRNKFIVEII